MSDEDFVAALAGSLLRDVEVRDRSTPSSARSDTIWSRRRPDDGGNWGIRTDLCALDRNCALVCAYVARLLENPTCMLMLATATGLAYIRSGPRMDDMLGADECIIQVTVTNNTIAVPSAAMY
mmetsp:Transcript_37749/g.111736  ORF Transcript_37749/g.111736 Transcript_37749/m.111736 type:complete len:123 (-) Transcript_37749:511-879(-)